MPCHYTDQDGECPLLPKLEECQTELKNFQDIVRHVIPTSGEIPRLPGIDVYGESLPLNGFVGGDHIVYLDFNQRYDLDRHIVEAEKAENHELAARLAQNKKKAGMLLADVSGHKITDAMLAAMLHQAFLIGVQYELKDHGEVTTELFESINTRFFHSSSQFKFITMIYGEIAEDGTFRFLSAAHPPPLVFSREFNRLVSIGSEHMVRFPPIGTMPSPGNWEAKFYTRKAPFKEKYSIRQISLMGCGDILLLYSDGLSEHVREDESRYFPKKLELVLRQVKDKSAREIFDAIRQDLVAFAPPIDDVSFIVIKKI